MHFNDFLRLTWGALILWVLVKTSEAVLLNEYAIQFDGRYLLSIITAGFALVWYRQFLLGPEQATYSLMIKHGFGSRGVSLMRIGRSIIRILLISVILMIPTMLLSAALLIFYGYIGETYSNQLMNDIVIKSTFIVMFAFSPILVRLSLLTVGFALGRKSMRMRQIWEQTRGYGMSLWLLVMRAFLPLSIYGYLVDWCLQEMTSHTTFHYLLTELIINIPAGIVTFVLLAIVVTANAEAFRILIGVREGDAPHRPDAGQKRDEQFVPAD